MREGCDLVAPKPRAAELAPVTPAGVLMGRLQAGPVVAAICERYGIEVTILRAG